MNNTCVIIVAAGAGKRMKSYGSKSLLQLEDGRTLLRKQLDTIRLSLNKPEIITVLGFDAEKIFKTLPDGIRAVENEHYLNTGVARSILMGLRASTAKKNIIVYGDLLFNKATLKNLPNESCVIIDSTNRMHRNEVGIVLDNNYAVHFDFGLSPKWCSIVQLVGRELELFKSIALSNDKKRLSGHEILNHIIDKGGSFKSYEPKKMKILEIDSNKDLSKSNKI